ncbi:MAG: hypothetical protein U0271_22485 [Polyangiaceae bacterium]
MSRHTFYLPLLVALTVATPLAGCKKPTSDSGDSDKKSDKSDKSDKNDKKSDKPKKPAAKTPDGVKISFSLKSLGSNTEVEISGVKADGEISCFGELECTLRLNKLPEDTKVKIGEVEETASSAGSVSVKFDMGDVIAKAAPTDALRYDKKVDPARNVDITFPDGVKVSEKLPSLSTNYMIESTLKKKLPNATPVLFGKEADAPNKTHTIFLTDQLGSDDIFGPAKTMSEIDLVAVGESLPERDGNKKCSGYKANGETGPGRDADLYLVDKEVKLYERRTGKIVDTKKFEAKAGECPMFANGSKATEYADSREIAAWLRTKK